MSQISEYDLCEISHCCITMQHNANLFSLNKPITSYTSVTAEQKLVPIIPNKYFFIYPLIKKFISSTELAMFLLHA